MAGVFVFYINFKIILLLIKRFYLKKGHYS